MLIEMHAYIARCSFGDLFRVITARCDWLVYAIWVGSFFWKLLFYAIPLVRRCKSGAYIITLHRPAGGRFTAPWSILEQPRMSCNAGVNYSRLSRSHGAR